MVSTEASRLIIQFRVYGLAAVAEIGGCFSFWAWLRLGRSPLWVVPGCCALVGFAYLLTGSNAAQAGRSFAAYGGIYIVTSLLWMWVVEGVRPDRWDVAGAAVCLVGVAIIMHGPRSV